MMRIFKIILFITALHSLSNAYVIPRNDKLIRLPIIRRSKPSIEKRSSPLEESYQLYNEKKIEYLTKIYIGTPPQEFYVSIDTGSADIWVPSTSCPKSECVFDKFIYNKSSTYQPMNLAFNIQYGQGSISGNYAKDKINLLGAESKLTIDLQPFGLVDSAKDDILSTEHSKTPTSNGILGLAFPALTANSDTAEAYDPFVFNLAAQGLISQNVFSIYLANMDEKDWSGQLTIGGIDHDKYIGDLHYIPVQKSINSKTSKLDYTFWNVQLDSINDIPNNHGNVMLDTGTTLSYLTKGMTEQIIKSVTESSDTNFDSLSELYIVDCSLKSSNKKVEISLGQGSVKLSIDMSDLVLPIVDNDNQCGFAITYNYDKENTLVFGDSILRSAYFVFDMDNKQVGIATALNSNSFVD